MGPHCGGGGCGAAVVEGEERSRSVVGDIAGTFSLSRPGTDPEGKQWGA